MEYNPYTQEYNRLQRVIENKNNEKRSLSGELSWFDATDVNRLYFSIEGEEDSKNKLLLLISTIEKEIEILHAKMQDTKSNTKTLFNPLNWFDDEQKVHRKKYNGLKKELGVKNECLERRKKSLSETNESINKYKNIIDKFKSFDREKISDDVHNLGQKIVLLEEEFKQISEIKNNIDIQLQPVLKQINDYKDSISAAKGNIRKAGAFEKKLNSAENSYNRAMIHQECENIFGESSPKKITRQQEVIIRKAERDLDKANKRAIKIVEKASRIIRKIIIDGNNMCYEGSDFVGLQPLIKATNEIVSNYKIIIVFDSAIRSQIKANDKMIRAQFDNNIKVHIVATKQLADETILDIASNDEFCYILSNDRFGEYMEKDVVKNSRVIRHEIVDGKIIIHDLNVNSRYD